MTDEQEQIARDTVLHRVREHFPESDTTTVRELVDRGFADLSSAQVRDFVELLVEREVSDALRSQARSSAATVDA